MSLPSQVTVPSQAPELVRTVNGDLDVLSADFLNERALHALPVAEPVAVPMSSLLIPFRRVEPGEAHFLSGHPYPVTVG